MQANLGSRRRQTACARRVEPNVLSVRFGFELKPNGSVPIQIRGEKLYGSNRFQPIRTSSNSYIVFGYMSANYGFIFTSDEQHEKKRRHTEEQAQR